MRFKFNRLKLVLIGISLAMIAVLALLWNAWAKSWRAPYLTTSGFSNLMEKYDGFIGMSLEDTTQLLTKNGMFIVVGENDDLSLRELIYDRDRLNETNTSGMSVLCIPLQNSKSPEECFIKGFLIDAHNTVVSEVDVRLTTDTFFEILHTADR